MDATPLDDAWEPTPTDRLLVEAKRWGTPPRFAVMLLFYRARGHFPRGCQRRLKPDPEWRPATKPSAQGHVGPAGTKL